MPKPDFDFKKPKAEVETLIPEVKVAPAAECIWARTSWSAFSSNYSAETIPSAE